MLPFLFWKLHWKNASHFFASFLLLVFLIRRLSGRKAAKSSPWAAILNCHGSGNASWQSYSVNPQLWCDSIKQLALCRGVLEPESSLWIIEDQAFSPSNDLAPSPSPPPSPVSKLDQRHRGRLRKRDSRGERKEGAKSHVGKKILVLYNTLNTLWIELSTFYLHAVFGH